MGHGYREKLCSVRRYQIACSRNISPKFSLQLVSTEEWLEKSGCLFFIKYSFKIQPLDVSHFACTADLHNSQWCLRKMSSEATSGSAWGSTQKVNGAHGCFCLFCSLLLLLSLCFSQTDEPRCEVTWGLSYPYQWRAPEFSCGWGTAIAFLLEARPGDSYFKGYMQAIPLFSLRWYVINHLFFHRISIEHLICARIREFSSKCGYFF